MLSTVTSFRTFCRLPGSTVSALSCCLYLRRSAISFRRITMSSANVEAARAKLMEEMKVDILTELQEADNEKARKEVSRSFISDTITVPTPEMYVYALKASLGDDVYHEPSTLALEAHIARLTGKEAGLFVPSGTMSNQLGLRTHLKQPPYSVLCDHRAHVHRYEAGGIAFHSGAAVIPVRPVNGHHLTLPDVEENVVISSDVHFAPTEVIEIENTLNGTIIPQDDIIAIATFARANNIKMHLDGARIWHVAAETGMSLKELCAPFDSASLCFSKGLGAPIGSCLVGNKEFIAKARWFRKLFGGGMRQTGILAGAAAYAVTHNFPLLPKVHELARKLEQGLEEAGCEILSRAETSMIFYDPSPVGVSYAEVGERASQLAQPLIINGSRLAVHIQTDPQAVDDLINIVKTLAEEKKAAGFVLKAKTVVNGNGSAYKDVYVRRRT